MPRSHLTSAILLVDYLGSGRIFYVDLNALVPLQSELLYFARAVQVDEHDRDNFAAIAGICQQNPARDSEKSVAAAKFKCVSIAVSTLVIFYGERGPNRIKAFVHDQLPPIRDRLGLLQILFWRPNQIA